MQNLPLGGKVTVSKSHGGRLHLDLPVLRCVTLLAAQKTSTFFFLK